MTDAAALDYLRATDLAKLAQITPCFEVYCKACDRWLAYKPHRGEAWLAFARHVALQHIDGLEAPEN